MVAVEHAGESPRPCEAGGSGGAVPQDCVRVAADFGLGYSAPADEDLSAGIQVAFVPSLLEAGSVAGSLSRVSEAGSAAPRFF